MNIKHVLWQHLERTPLARDREDWWAVVNTVMKQPVQILKQISSVPQELFAAKETPRSM